MLDKYGYFEMENKILAGYAMKSEHSRGRKQKEDLHPYRSPYQRDKDRIIHSTAFRRLEYKTQVFVNHQGDHYRTRLTHSLEVAQISRTMARFLQVNEDLAEAIALAHDLGHTPFGHSGEAILNKLMKDHGGFEHNKQSLRIVEVLEHRYPNFRGLNLTYEVREGLIKHHTTYDKPAFSLLHPEENATIETQIVNLADEIAYVCHDVDDGITSGILDEQEIYKNVKLWKKVADNVLKNFTNLDLESKKNLIVRYLLNELVTDVLNTTAKNITNNNIKTVEDVRKFSSMLVSFSKDFFDLENELKEYLYKNMYFHPKVFRMSAKAQRILSDLFNTYMEEPRQLPLTTQKKIFDLNMDKHQVICDYIAGMTDRYALQEYEKLFLPFKPV